MFGLGWHPARATVVERRVLKKTFQTWGTLTLYEYMLDVRPDDGSPAFRTTAKDPFNMVNWRQPAVSDTVRVAYHSDRNVKWDRHDPLLRQENKPSRTAEGDREWAALAAAGPVDELAEERAASAALPKATEGVGYTGTAEALRRAKAAGDTAEVERLKNEFKRHLAED